LLYSDNELGGRWFPMPDAPWIGPSDIAAPVSTGRANDALICPRHVRCALAYLRQHYTENVSLAALAAAAGTSVRTMQRNFARFVGLSPQAFLRRLRLAAVREDLAKAEDSVSQVAARHGFSHFGRFAIVYRACFGETPSATQQRARRAAQPAITARNRPPASTPCLVVGACCIDGAGRETRVFAETLGEQMAASLCAASFLSVRLLPAQGDHCAPGHATARTKLASTASYLLTARVIPPGRSCSRRRPDGGRRRWPASLGGNVRRQVRGHARVPGHDREYRGAGDAIRRHPCGNPGGRQQAA
jgi:AraC-like DNA-binding protein